MTARAAMLAAVIGLLVPARANAQSSTPHLVQDIAAGATSSLPRFLTDVNGTLFFVATEDSSGATSLWATDGTSQGTRKLLDSACACDGMGPIGKATGTALFARYSGGQWELWKSDGSPLGTNLVKVLSGGVGSMQDLNGIAVFTADDAVSGLELWKSDGTALGTTLVKDINPGPNGSQPTAPLSAVDGAWVFGADDGAHGHELWTTDGSEGGTTLLKDLNPGAAGSYPNYFTAFGSTVFFVADDGVHGQELWTTDGTPGGTQMLKDIKPGADSSAPYGLTIQGTTLFFSADGPPAGTGLWMSDGTVAGTQELAPVSNISGLTSSGGLLYFIGSGDDGSAGGKLWRSDATPGGTLVIRSFAPTNGGAAIHSLVDRDGVLFFRADDGIRGSEVWSTTGTLATTVLVQDINPGPASSQPVLDPPWVMSGSQLFLTADDLSHGAELWVLPAGTLISCASPVVVVPDGRLISGRLPAGATGWFGTAVSPEHSYSVEFKAAAVSAVLPGNMTVFAGGDGCDANSTLAPRDTTAIDPTLLLGGSRAALTLTGTSPLFRTRLVNDGNADATYTFSVAETTMFSPAWSTGGAFDTFYSFENTTGASVAGTLTLFDIAGTPLPPLILDIPAGHTASTSTSALGIVRGRTGSARLTHDGPPGAILAAAAIANLMTSPAYVQPVRFRAVRETR